MENTTAPLTVTATDRDTRDRELNAAVTAMREQAMIDGQRGILVTRHSPETYTIELSESVPFGFTHEHDRAS